MDKKKIIGGTALLATGLIAGSMFSIAGANASTSNFVKPAHVQLKVATTTTPDPTASTAPTPTPSNPSVLPTPPTFGKHTPETVITGDLATELSNLALAKYSGATVDRIENDSDGATYEAHLTLTDGSHVTVLFDANKNITAVETGHKAPPAAGYPTTTPGTPGYPTTPGTPGLHLGHHHGDGDNDGKGGDDDGDDDNNAASNPSVNWGLNG